MELTIKSRYQNTLPYYQLKQQQGVVLVVALVFLVALTAVAAALMQMTTTDIKMSDASQEKVIATQEAISAIDEVVFDQINTPNQANGFAASNATFPINPVVDVPNTSAEIAVATPNDLVVDCPHSRIATSNDVFKCNALRIRVTKLYGRSNTSTIQVTSGIAQQILP